LAYPGAQQFTLNRKNEHNLWRFHGDAAVSAVDDAAVNYQSPSILAAGANAQSITILATLINLCMALICIKAPAFIERIGKGKRGAMTLAVLNFCAWMPLILMFFFAPKGIGPGWVAALWLINVIPGMLLTFQRDNWLSNIVPRERLGRYLGQRLAIKSAFYLGAFCFLGYMLDSMGEISLAHFAVVFVIASGASLVDFLIFSSMHEPHEKQFSSVQAPKVNIKFGMFDFMGEIKAKKLHFFMTFTSLFYLTVGLSGPLYAVYMLQEQHFSYLSYTIVIAAEFLARVISAPFWGRYADKAGNIKVLSVISRIIPIIPIFWLFCSNVGYLAMVQTLSGISWGAYDLCTQNYIYKVAPPEKKLRYIVYTRCFILFSTAMGGIGGVYLIREIFPIFGSQILSVFLVVGILRALTVLVLRPKLIDMAMSYGRTVSSPEVELDTTGQIKVIRHGLFYHREKPPRPVLGKGAVKNRAAVFTAQPANIAHRQPVWRAQEPKSPILKNGMIELPENVKVTPQQDWLNIQRSIEKKKKEAQTMETETMVINPRRHPWLHNEEVARYFHKQTTERNMATQAKTASEKSSREGLFYNSGAWSDYKQASLKTAMLEAERLRDQGEEITPEPRENAFEYRPGIAGTDVTRMFGRKY
jgi:hypothetical protein